MINVPNAITLLRFVLVPVIGLQLLHREYGVAFAPFIVSALSDLADGMVARHWNLRTRFGAIADPLADKLTMLTGTVFLTLANWLPWWFALAVVLRDGLIVSGALAYNLPIGSVEMAPTRISTLNTALNSCFSSLCWRSQRAMFLMGTGCVFFSWRHSRPSPCRAGTMCWCGAARRFRRVRCRLSRGWERECIPTSKDAWSIVPVGSGRTHGDEMKVRTKSSDDTTPWMSAPSVTTT